MAGLITAAVSSVELHHRQALPALLLNRAGREVSTMGFVLKCRIAQCFDKSRPRSRCTDLECGDGSSPCASRALSHLRLFYACRCAETGFHTMRRKAEGTSPRHM